MPDLKLKELKVIPADGNYYARLVIVTEDNRLFITSGDDIDMNRQFIWREMNLPEVD